MQTVLFPGMFSAVRWAVAITLLASTFLGCGHEQSAEPLPRTKPAPRLGAEACVTATECQTGTENSAPVNRCPRVAIEATPLVAFVGTDVRLLSQTVDPEGDALSFVWSADPDGTLDAPTQRMTFYRCPSAGKKELALHVTDARGCRASGQLEVTCTEPKTNARTAALRARRIR